MNVDKKVLVGLKKNYNWCGVSGDGRVVNDTQIREAFHIFLEGVGGVMVSIVAFQAVDPGLIPGQRKPSLLF